MQLLLTSVPMFAVVPTQQFFEEFFGLEWNQIQLIATVCILTFHIWCMRLPSIMTAIVTFSNISIQSECK
jgi:hypothetical protein